MKKTNAFLITATDTGVGKTFVASGITRQLIDKGVKTVAMKPVETGCDKIIQGRLVGEDAIALKKAAQSDEPFEAINPYALRHPLAPSVAAELEGVAIDRHKIIHVFLALMNRYEMVVVEGAGGLMTPIYQDYLFVDMAKDMELPIVVVARAGLGAINHSLLTLHAARSQGLKICGVVLNQSSPAPVGAAEKTNPSVIATLGKTRILAVIPYESAHSALDGMFNRLTDNILDALVET
jgi:dethiobiotin synthetase